MAKTKIEWCDYTFNPWWGCHKVSAGCKHCYAEGIANRFGNNIWGPPASSSRRLFGEGHWSKPIVWNEKARREGIRFRVFCASMADVFEDHPAVVIERIKLWALIENTPHLDWLLLTKRPHNISEMLPASWLDNHAAMQNVWLGTSIEDQMTADARIPLLLTRHAGNIKFVSYEPALEPVDISRYLGPSVVLPVVEPVAALRGSTTAKVVQRRYEGVTWVIGGAESGPYARPMDDNWMRAVRDQCDAKGAAFFLKQKVDNGKKISLPVLDGRRHSDWPMVQA